MEKSRQFKKAQREADKDVECLFVEEMQKALSGEFPNFEKSASKGNEESQWICSVLAPFKAEKKYDKTALKMAFAKTNCPRGWFWTAMFCDENSWERFICLKTSAEGGYKWAEALYGRYYFSKGGFVERNGKTFTEWLKKSMAQECPLAMQIYIETCKRGIDDELIKIIRRRFNGICARWIPLVKHFAKLVSKNEGKMHLVEAIRASVYSGCIDIFKECISKTQIAINTQTLVDLKCSVDYVTMEIGYSLYWFLYDTNLWQAKDKEEKYFTEKCLAYYCDAMDLQQHSVLFFMHFWNNVTGIKDIGRKIGKMVWFERYKNLLIKFGEKMPKKKSFKKLKV